MADENTSVELLKQANRTLKDELSGFKDDAYKKIEAMQSAIDQQKGKSGLLSAALPILLGVIMTFGGKGIVDKLNTHALSIASNKATLDMRGPDIITAKDGASKAKSAVTANGTAIAALNKHVGIDDLDHNTGNILLAEKIAENTRLVNDTRDRKKAKDDEHDGRIISLELDMKDFSTRLKGIESDLLGDEGKFSDFERRITRLDGLSERHSLFLDEHEQELDSVELKQSAMQTGVSSIKASTAAAFTEVETQIRATTEIINLARQYAHSVDTMLWQATFETDLPENDFYPRDIPAKATTQTGIINGNGH